MLFLTPVDVVAAEAAVVVAVVELIGKVVGVLVVLIDCVCPVELLQRTREYKSRTFEVPNLLSGLRVQIEKYGVVPLILPDV